MAKIIWFFRSRNEEVFRRVKVERNVLHKIKQRRVNWISHNLCTSCLLKRVIGGQIEGRIEVAERGERRRKKLLDELKKRGELWKLKKNALARTVWRTRFGRGCGLVV